MKKIILLLFILLIPTALGKSGSMKLLAVSTSGLNEQGSTADLFLEIKQGEGRVFIDSFPLSKLDTQISTRFAKEVACNFLERDCSNYDFFYTIRSNSPIVGGPSAGASIAVLTISVLEDLQIDDSSSITGTINSGGIIGPVGGILPKIEAAAKSGIKKVLIPKYSRVNKTNLTEYQDKFNIEIIEVSQLSEVIKEFTGKEYGNNGDLNISDDYVETMKTISKDLCNRANSLTSEYANYSNSTAVRLLNRGSESLNKNEFYSAASYCFGSSLNARYQKLLQDNLNDKQIKDMIVDILDQVKDYKNHTGKKTLKTITDLETYMVVNDRLSESKQHLTDALFNLAMNNTNATLFELAYGIERLNSAQSWSVFFGKPGRSFVIDKDVLEASCIKKIQEVEERIQYIELYLPSGTEDARDSVRKSYNHYNSGDSELCLYESSVAKARIDLVLNNIAIEQEHLDEVINDRSRIVKSLIAKQNQKGNFPILGYSYYEYANSLKENDQFSALLYLEYALELGNLDIYFEKKSLELPKIPIEYVVLYMTGLITGFLAGVIIFKVYRKRR